MRNGRLHGGPTEREHEHGGSDGTRNQSKRRHETPAPPARCARPPIRRRARRCGERIDPGPQRVRRRLSEGAQQRNRLLLLGQRRGTLRLRRHLTRN